jgi:hypothetical protein
MQGEAVYVNAQEGFRFVPPPNWSLHSRAELPPGPVSEERLLVAYRRAGGGKVSSLDVSMADVPTSEDLDEVVRERGGGGWKSAGPVESLKLGDRPAARAAYRSRSAAPAEAKEVVAVRNGGRVYFFTALFAADDEKAQAQVRKSLETLSW